MRSQKKLFFLIKSLNPTEKRYFKLYSQRNGKPKSQLYLKLFTLIGRQAKYDEVALKTHFKDTSFGHSLAFPKSHLYQQLLRALQAFHYEKSSPGRFGSYLEKVALLAERGFPDQALRIVEKRLKEAIQLQLCLPVLQLLRWQRRLVLRLQSKNYAEIIGLISDQETHWEGLFLQEQAAIRLHDTLYLALQAARRKTKAHKAPDLQAKKRALDLLGSQPTLSFESKIAIWRAQAHYAHLMDDFTAVHFAYQQEVKLWQTHPQHLRLNAMRFVRTFGAWLNSKTLIRDYENLLAEIRRLRQQKGMGKPEQALIFRITYALELFYYLNSNQFASALQVAPQIIAGLKQFASYLSPGFKLGFYHNLAILHWLGGQAKEAQHWVQKILHFEPGEVRKDIREFAPLLEKILYWERGHLAPLESWFRALQYQRRKGSPPKPLESILFRLIRKLPEQSPHASAAHLYTRFLTELAQYAEQAEVSKLGLEELKIWALAQNSQPRLNT
ncbi:MAG TPA: hypothetical protein ENJ82_10685 [Bacteroidetes bacterium]|nr:hypothetical protein [Bacteroidota bacterium]